jgi:formamidopyrimidine-DNA glycosylase
VPEILEVELYRRAAETIVGHTIVGVDTPDAWFLKRGLTPAAVQRALKKRTVMAARRRGKLLLLDTDGPVLGLRFGMTGRLVVDGRAAVTDMEYGSERDLPGWDRFQLRLDGRRTLRINDPRRLGGVGSILTNRRSVLMRSISPLPSSERCWGTAPRR